MTSVTDAADAGTVFASICRSLAQIATGAGGPGPMLDLAKEVAKLVQGLIEKLNSIEEKVILIQEGPYKTGLNFLKNAEAAKSDESKLREIERAAEQFMIATGQSKGPLLVRAHFYAGACYDLLGRMDVAANNYCTAFDVAWGYERETRNSLPLINYGQIGKLLNKSKIQDLNDFHSYFLYNLAILWKQRGEAGDYSDPVRLKRARQVVDGFRPILKIFNQTVRVRTAFEPQG